MQDWIQIFDVTSYHVGQRQLLSGGIAAWEQSHVRKTIWLKLFPGLLFNQFISKPLLHTAPNVVYRWRKVLEKINFCCDYWDKQIQWGWNFFSDVILLLVTTLSKFQFLWEFLVILQNLLIRYVWNPCDQSADMVRIENFSWHYQIDVGFAIHEAARIKHEAIQYFFYSILRLSNFAEF